MFFFLRFWPSYFREEVGHVLVFVKAVGPNNNEPLFTGAGNCCVGTCARGSNQDGLVTSA